MQKEESSHDQNYGSWWEATHLSNHFCCFLLSLGARSTKEKISTNFDLEASHVNGGKFRSNGNITGKLEWSNV